MTALPYLYRCLRFLFRLAATAFGGVGMAYWLLSFSHGDAGGEAVIHLGMAMLLFYARERTHG